MRSGLPVNLFLTMPQARRVSIVRQNEMSTVRWSRFAGGREGASVAVPCARIGEASVNSFLRIATLYTARRRQVIQYEGRPTDEVYLVEKGRIKCTSTASDGRELLVCEVEAGEFFGLVEALSGALAVATAVATELTTLKCVRMESFRALVAGDPVFALTVLQVLAQRLRLAYERSTELAYEPIERRVLRTLSKLASKHDGTVVVNRAVSINELASMVAASRTRVSLTVQDLIRRRLLGRVEGKFVLPSEAQPLPTLPR